MSPPLSLPPSPSDPGEILRWETTRKRRRLLYSCHRPDLDGMLERMIGSVRRDAWGEPDLSANPYLSLWEQTSRLYAERPVVIAPPGSEDVADAAAAGGLWSLMQRVQRDTLALREMAVRVELVGARPVYTPMFPDLLEALADPSEPGQPVVLTETRWEPGVGWVRVTWDARVPTYTARDDKGRDVSAVVLGGQFEGDAYPYRVEGRPVVPAVLYHAAETARLWDPYTGAEIVEGALRLGVFLTFFGHVLRNCAWSQRYAAGVEFAGQGAESQDGAQAARREIVTDPATVLLLAVADGGGQPMVGQWGPPIAPDTLMRAIGQYEERLVEAAGLRVDVTRQTSDVRSGYSLAVARDAIREAQAVYAPLFARCDARLLTLTAALMGRPAGEWSVIHSGLPQSPAERQAAVNEVTTLLDKRLIGRVEARMRLNPGETEAQARAALARVDAEQASPAPAPPENGAQA